MATGKTTAKKGTQGRKSTARKTASSSSRRSASKKNNKQYKDAFDSILFKMTTNKIQNQELTHLRDSLLPMLMNGQVIVE